ncbi:MAG TPA: SapC family protein [Burkholderiales bacterium]|nr:SapC family protein [Burkholderiales bacterium]
MKITPPFGYDEIVPLRREHRVLMPAGGSTPAFCRTLNAIAISAAEFPVAGRDYPLVFASLDAGKTFAPVAVLGLTQSSNLYVDAGGSWDPSTYVPAFVRRYPFCISKLYVDGVPAGERVVCVAQAYLDRGGIALFDARGKPTPRWQPLEQLLAQYEADLDRTADLCAALARLALLTPFSMQVRGGQKAVELRMGGMYRVDEARLHALRPASHKALVNKGYMSAIYAHLHSLDNFTRLYARQLRARGAPQRSA